LFFEKESLPNLAGVNHHDKRILLSPFFHMGKRGKEKRILNRQELPGSLNSTLLVEIGHQLGINMVDSF
jgi:hypothetical protein